MGEKRKNIWGAISWTGISLEYKGQYIHIIDCKWQKRNLEEQQVSE